MRAIIHGWSALGPGSRLITVILTGVAWTAISMQHVLLHPEFWDPVTLTDYVAVYSFSVALLTLRVEADYCGVCLRHLTRGVSGHVSMLSSVPGEPDSLIVTTDTGDRIRAGRKPRPVDRQTRPSWRARQRRASPDPQGRAGALRTPRRTAPVLTAS